VWDAETGAELLILSGHTADVWQAAWNADESRILTASNDDTARVWDVETGNEVVVLSPHADGVWWTVWNADGSRILTTGCDRYSEDRCWEGTARVWDAETGAELLIPLGHEFGVNRAVWNEDGSRILTAGSDGTAGVWNAETGAKMLTFSAYTYGVWQVTWNADGSHILTTGCDRYSAYRCWEGAARVWDAETGTKLFTLSGHTDPVAWAAWNADESRILTASYDGTVRLWYTRMEDLLAEACRRAPRNMTQEEWRRFMKHEPDYRATCPNLPLPEE
jgi:WD40 repeat protein